MKLKATIEHKPNIPTASMADIAFLLIIFFMLTITFEVDKTQVTLPKTTLRYEIPKQSAYVSIDPNGRIRVSDGTEQSALVSAADEVLSMAAGVIAMDPQKVFVVKSHGDVDWLKVDEVIDALKRAKVRDVYLLSDQVTVDDL
ncbi:MAG: biopolymer transporter ExbD [Acidobacteriota bacterium]|nr:biopolymer transporter ExbD [Acidobacteriota bacterium]MDE2922816.1 biopolymer transporter ExbD [Acidobacteriota bacterium]MDE3263372.1 biopolymer transporter ExbD [Acidobacteriota bacterium]MXX75536.1 biopolymer transporter ExbD [Holophagales bacterium]